MEGLTARVVPCSPGMRTNTETQDAAHRDGWSAGARGRAGDERLPRLRLLYHSDLARMGSLSAPGAIPQDAILQMESILCQSL